MRVFTSLRQPLNQGPSVGIRPERAREGTLVGYTKVRIYLYSASAIKKYPHRKSHNLLYNLPLENKKPSPEMVN